MYNCTTIKKRGKKMYLSHLIAYSFGLMPNILFNSFFVEVNTYKYSLFYINNGGAIYSEQGKGFAY